MDDLAVYFRFLDELRESGKINMLGAAAPLAKAFDLSKGLARSVHLRWMESFDGESTPEERARSVEGVKGGQPQAGTPEAQK